MKRILFTIPLILISFISLSQRHGTGLVFDDEEYNKIEAPKKAFGYGDKVPEQASLREYVPLVRSQGQYGTCVGWASSYYAATIEYSILAGISDIREISGNAFDPYYTYLSIVNEESYFDCERGTVMEYACEHLVNNGVKRFSYEKYTCGSKISDKVKNNQSVLNFKDYYRIYDDGNSLDENILAVKRALVDKHPVIIGMRLPTSFRKIESDGLLRPEEDDYFYGGHAMTIVGYDDNQFGGCFTIANSWGDNWGDNGFLYVKYEDYNEFNRSAFYFETELNSKSGQGCALGDCVSDYGRYTFSNDAIYEGDFHEGQPAGHGIYYWDDNSFFSGEWESGARHGIGEYTDENLQKLNGYWKDGTYNGNSYVENSRIIDLYTDESGVVSIDHFRHIFVAENALDLFSQLKLPKYLDLVEKLDLNGCVYGDCENGVGMYVKSEKYVYFGRYRNGVRAGYGEMYWLNDYRGHVYSGDYFDGNREGNGTYLFPSGDKYAGSWKSNEKHGLGTYFYKDGKIDAGDWKEGVFEDGGFGFGNKQAKEINAEKENVVDKKITSVKK